jgi:hypothetical protein
MYNDHLSQEEANELIRQRMKEAETYGLQKQLGFSDSRAARWVLLLIIVIVAVVFGLLL